MFVCVCVCVCVCVRARSGNVPSSSVQKSQGNSRFWPLNPNLAMLKARGAGGGVVGGRQVFKYFAFWVLLFNQLTNRQFVGEALQLLLGEINNLCGGRGLSQRPTHQYKLKEGF